MTLDDIGVVIIGRNEGVRLIDCLRSVQLNAKHIVYVNSGSTDGSVETAERLGACVVALGTESAIYGGKSQEQGLRGSQETQPRYSTSSVY